MRSHSMSKIGLCLGVPVAALLYLGFGASVRGEPSFWAGFAKRDITPKEPVPMWGYGGRRAALSEGALDPLWATALVLKAGTNKVALVGLDLGRSPADASLETVRQRIRAEAGIAHSFIAGSHTHHGPVLELKDEEGKGQGTFDAALRYYRELENAIATAILEADSTLKPAKIAVGSAELAAFNRNRHTKLEPKPVDRALAVMRLDNLEGKPLALLVNFAAHPTMIPAATMKFSADYVGSLRSAVEEALGCGVVFLQGACGDLSVDRGPHQGYEAFGRALGQEVIRLASGLQTKDPNPARLQVKETRYKFSSRTDFGNPLLRAAYSLAFFPELVANYVDQYASGVQPLLTVGLLNSDTALVGVSGEFFCDHAIRLRQRARVSQLIFVGYCNGYHQYFPTIEAAAEGGYGADNRVAPAEVGAGEQMMDRALLWIYEMQGKLN